jgi:uncharacterized protein (DUF1330 family)
VAKPAYMIIAIDVHDAGVLDTYRDQAMPLLQEFGAELIVATDKFELTDGAWPRQRIVLLKFSTLDQANAFWNAPAYQPMKALRETASEQDTILVEGLFDEDPDATSAPDVTSADGTPHYLLGAASVTDPSWVEEYMQKVPPISAKFGVQALASGNEFTVLDGAWPRDAVVLLKFPSEQVFRDFWYGEDYRPMKELREANSVGDHIAFAGLPS